MTDIERYVRDSLQLEASLRLALKEIREEPVLIEDRTFEQKYREILDEKVGAVQL